jgi:apoptosis-inducing factor 2
MRFPEKKLTIISAPKVFLERLAKNVNDLVFKHFSSNKNVNFVMGERVEKVKGNKIITDKGTTIESDFIFACIGFQPVTNFMKSKMEDCLENGYVKVNQYLQFEKNTNFFAGGDVTNVKQEKLAQYAEEHSDYIYKNIFAVIQKKDKIVYKSKTKMMVVSMGTKSLMVYKKIAYYDGYVVNSLKNFIDYKVTTFK